MSGSDKRGNFPCPAVSRAGSGRALMSSPFNEGISVPPAEWAREVAANPALASRDRKERSEAISKAILGGSLAKYRGR